MYFKNESYEIFTACIMADPSLHILQKSNFQTTDIHFIFMCNSLYSFLFLSESLVCAAAVNHDVIDRKIRVRLYCGSKGRLAGNETIAMGQ